ncbi:serine protease [Mesorhizobium sp. Cs1299R1N1]|uniref:trypsin-like serine peptidase n=1 Tax=Mesorhizobium sp. Cs1299R1N1 TaxID=3015172 RepID=UPI00301CC0EC
MVDELEPRLDRTAKRVRKLFFGGGRGALGVGFEGAAPPPGPESTLEAGGTQNRMPDERDVQAITARLLAARAASGRVMNPVEAEGLARTIVANANRALLDLDGAPDGSLGQKAAMALEAVVQVRGRPAVRILAEEFDRFTDPDSEIWQLLAGEHFDAMWAIASATAAVKVTERFITNRSWVQGTAFLIGPGMAMTNRHVLFPPDGGVRLGRRFPGTTTARLKGDFEITLDFAFDNGRVRENVYRVVGVPFVAEDNDPVDAAILAVEPMSGPQPAPLPISRSDAFDVGRLYIVGHPGYLENVPEDILTVFGRPDERKRVSFGQLMDPEQANQAYIVHDASTIGGYSGAAVLGFGSNEVRALHYWGDSTAGNRAVGADAIRRHPVIGPMLT